MESNRNKHISSRKKPLPPQNPELMTAQLTLSKSPNPKQQSQSQQVTINPKQVLLQAQQLLLTNQALQCINLLKGLLEYLRNIKYTDQKMLIIIHTNLAVSYYKVGFLEEAYDQFSVSLSMIKDIGLSIKNVSQINKSIPHNTSTKNFGQKLRYDMLTTRIQLQTCILFSQMGKHQLALDHAKISCRSCYCMIYDLQILLYQTLNTLLTSHHKNKTNYASAYSPETQIVIEGYQNLINNIVIIDQLLASTKDLKKQYMSAASYKDKIQLLEDEKKHINRIGKLPAKTNIQQLYALIPENVDSLWIYKNKILDEIQMKFINQDILDTKNILQNTQIIQKIVFLAISLYCFSTQTRFMEKDNSEKDPCQVLDSEHLLSRSLEIAYSFMPHQAPILNQILTVHDRFHGIDKQTIPQDKQIEGFFKVLRPLSKPKSLYSTKNIMCSPIMIRIQVPKISIEGHEMEIDSQFDLNNNKQSNKTVLNKGQFANKTIDLDSITKNNKIRGLNTTKKFDFTQISQSVIRRKHNTKIDFSENLKNIYASRKMKSATENNAKNDKMKINLTNIKDLKDEADFKEGGGVKSMRRPHSYDREINKPDDHFFPIQTERKKKSFSQSKREGPKQRRTGTNSNSTGLKLDGLQMFPYKKLQQQHCFQFDGKLADMDASKMGGNIFINNNINLFISKDSIQNSNQNSKDSTKTVYQAGRRQTYINRRKAHNSNFTGFKNTENGI